MCIKALLQELTPPISWRSVFLSIFFAYAYRYNNPFILLAMPSFQIWTKKLDMKDIPCFTIYCVRLFLGIYVILLYFYFFLNIGKCVASSFFSCYVLLSWHSGKMSSLVFSPKGLIYVYSV